MNFPLRRHEPLRHTDELTELLPDAAVQLDKDCAAAGVNTQFGGRIIGDVFDLRDALAAVLISLGGPGSERVYRLLYRADVPEAQVTQALAQRPEQPFETLLAELLVIRALQKVWFRKHYST